MLQVSTPFAEAWNIPYMDPHRWLRPGMFPGGVAAGGARGALLHAGGLAVAGGGVRGAAHECARRARGGGAPLHRRRALLRRRRHLLLPRPARHRVRLPGGGLLRPPGWAAGIYTNPKRCDGSLRWWCVCAHPRRYRTAGGPVKASEAI
eukprot:4597337-Pyramimonas_sp.AAC.2